MGVDPHNPTPARGRLASRRHPRVSIYSTRVTSARRLQLAGRSDKERPSSPLPGRPSAQGSPFSCTAPRPAPSPAQPPNKRPFSPLSLPRAREEGRRGPRRRWLARLAHGSPQQPRRRYRRPRNTPALGARAPAPRRLGRPLPAGPRPPLLPPARGSARRSPRWVGCTSVRRTERGSGCTLFSTPGWVPRTRSHFPA